MYMQRMEGRRLSFSLDINEKFPEVSIMPIVINKQRVPGRSKVSSSSSYSSSSSSSSSSSTLKMFQYVRSNVVKAIRMVSKKHANSGNKKRASNNMVVYQHQHYVPHRDSHHSEAMDDCIEFINSSCKKAA